MVRIRVFNQKRRFRGNQHKKVKQNAGISSPGPSNQSSNDAFTSVTPPSASKKKLTYLPHAKNVKTQHSTKSSNCNIIIDISVLSEFIKNSVMCPICHTRKCISISEDATYRRGLSGTLKLQCDHCQYNTSTRTSACSNKISDVNVRFCYAMRSIGKGRESARLFCAVMNLPPPPKHFDTYNKLLCSALEEVSNVSMMDAAKETKDLENSEDISAMFDGSWQKRGHTSMNGVVTVTSFITGKVIDVITYSKFCVGCQKGGDHLCQKNFDGYSGGMEVEGAVSLCQRSEATRGLRYVRYLGDGDSKGFLSVVAAKPYGDDVPIEKLECVGHIQKRMGTRLRKICKDYRGKKLSDGKGIGGRDRLTSSAIDQLQNYYGMAIRANTGNLEEMKKAVWATFFHKLSTDGTPCHGLCPKGPTSWCGYQKCEATGNVYSHKHSLPHAVLDIIKPVYRDLADPKLLSRCLHGKTQNQNESFNSCIWQRLPKTVYVGAITLKIGVLDSVICFNDGSYKKVLVLEKIGIEPGANMRTGLTSIDMDRVTKAEKAAQEMTKQARMQKRGKKRKMEDKETCDQDSYGPGSF